LPIYSVILLKALSDEVANLVLEAKQQGEKSSHFQCGVSACDTEWGQRFSEQRFLGLCNACSDLYPRRLETSGFGLKH
jgi:hypothetical protein